VEENRCGPLKKKVKKNKRAKLVEHYEMKQWISVRMGRGLFRNVDIRMKCGNLQQG
jgi:hypothetical protein